MPEARRVGAALAGAAAALGVMAGVALASRGDIGAPSGESELRLALRAATARLEICRERTAAELEALPAHFRLTEECDEVPVDYRLTVTVDGEPWRQRVVSHRGIRRTRPLTVDEALRLPPGDHRIRVRFEPLPLPTLAAGAAPGAGGAAWTDRARRAFDALPAPALDANVEFIAGRAVLIHLDDQGRLAIQR